MNSVCCHSPLVYPTSCLTNKNQRESGGNLFRFSSSETGKVRLPHLQTRSSSSMEAKSMADFMVVAATSAPQSTDLSVLLPVSGLLVFVYWISNFVVPDLLMKSYQSSNEAGGNQTAGNPMEEEDEEDEEDEEEED